MAKQERSNEKYGECNKTVRNGIFCEGRCQKWYHCGCGGLSEGELCQLGSSDEEWRCEKCAKEFEEVLTLYRPMTPYGVMRLMFPYDQ